MWYFKIQVVKKCLKRHLIKEDNNKRFKNKGKKERKYLIIFFKKKNF